MASDDDKLFAEAMGRYGWPAAAAGIIAMIGLSFVGTVAGREAYNDANDGCNWKRFNNTTDRCEPKRSDVDAR